MDSDDYESGDEDNSGTEETDEKEETDPTEDGEEEEYYTESSQITYGSAFVGAIIFSLVNLRKYNVVPVFSYQWTPFSIDPRSTIYITNILELDYCIIRIIKLDLTTDWH